MQITEIRVQNLWSFGPDPVLLEDMGVHNVVIGKNNSGKSRVLTALRWLKANAANLMKLDPFPLDAGVRHVARDGTESGPPALRVTATLSEARRNAVLGQMTERFKSKELLRHVEPCLGRRFTVGIEPAAEDRHRVAAAWDFGGTEPAELAPAGHGETAGHAETERDWKRNFRTALVGYLLPGLTDRLRYVGGWRTLDGQLEDRQNIVQLLRDWRGAGEQERHLRRSFTQVQAAFRELTLTPDFEIVPEKSGNTLYLESAGRYLPIGSWGDGIQHLLMIAFHLVTAPDSILLLEEPETHLHPELQRNLMRVLRRDLRGQSIITTHSPALLDAGLATRAYRVEHDRGASRATFCRGVGDLHATLDLLDVRASDLLQANLVIWVEGPTDRMFLNHCLGLLHPGLREGLHYQVAYYGGSVRSHVCFGDNGVGVLADLMKLSRHVAMVCDSDRCEESEGLDEAKARLQAECEGAGGHYWVTDGREIENYLPDEVLTAAYRDLLGEGAVALALPRYANLDEVLSEAFPSPRRGDSWKVKYDANKVQVMPHLLRHLKAEDLHRHGLRDRLDALIGRIKQANPDLR